METITVPLRRPEHLTAHQFAGELGVFDELLERLPAVPGVKSAAIDYVLWPARWLVSDQQVAENRRLAVDWDAFLQLRFEDGASAGLSDDDLHTTVLARLASRGIDTQVLRFRTSILLGDDVATPVGTVKQIGLWNRASRLSIDEAIEYHHQHGALVMESDAEGLFQPDRYLSSLAMTEDPNRWDGLSETWFVTLTSMKAHLEGNVEVDDLNADLDQFLGAGQLYWATEALLWVSPVQV